MRLKYPGGNFIELYLYVSIKCIENRIQIVQAVGSVCGEAGVPPLARTTDMLLLLSSEQRKRKIKGDCRRLKPTTITQPTR